MSNTSSRRFGLSKSKIAAFEQCPRRLWLQVHEPDRAEVDEGAEQRFAAGNTVGGLACALHPAGVMVEAEPDLGAAVAETSRLIAEGHKGPIFEATFQHNGVLVRVDLLERAGKRDWRAIEVKGSGSVKPQYHGDLATQVWVMREAGIKLKSAAIRHLNTSFVLERENDYTGIFTDAELLAEVGPLVEKRAEVAAEARKMLGADEPDIAPGGQCNSPYDCPFIGWCTRDLPEGPEWPVTVLPRGGGKKWLKQGIDDLLDLNADQLTTKQAHILEATRTGMPYHDVEGVLAEMSKWSWPRIWLDFETINPAIPLWIGTRPFQQVPFQFSAHVETEDGHITHHEFLDTSGRDPRAACAQALVDCIPTKGTVIAYYSSFEIGRLNELADAFPTHAKALRSMAQRTVDLLPIAQKHWYHRDQRGSWSIKEVLPTMVADGYAGLEVKDGGGAQDAYLEAINPETSDARRRAIDAALRAYCKLDTQAMIDVARVLSGEAKVV